MLVAVALTLAPTAASSDVTATITPGGPSVTVTISAANDNARITFDGTAGQRVFVNLSGTTKYVGTRHRHPADRGHVHDLPRDPQGTANGSATVTAYDVPADPAPPVQPSQAGTAAKLSITVPGQNDLGCALGNKVGGGTPTKAIPTTTPSSRSGSGRSRPCP